MHLFDFVTFSQIVDCAVVEMMSQSLIFILINYNVKNFGDSCTYSVTSH